MKETLLGVLGFILQPNLQLLKNAPHTIADLVDANWDRPYSREQAVYPVAGLQDYKFWPAVGRIDQAYGDRNLVCSCLPMDAYSQE